MPFFYAQCLQLLVEGVFTFRQALFGFFNLPPGRFVLTLELFLDLELFLLRGQLETALKAVNYVPAKVGTN